VKVSQLNEDAGILGAAAVARGMTEARLHT
jgi:hypothetical protein